MAHQQRSSSTTPETTYWPERVRYGPAGIPAGSKTVDFSGAVAGVETQQFCEFLHALSMELDGIATFVPRRKSGLTECVYEWTRARDDQRFAQRCAIRVVIDANGIQACMGYTHPHDDPASSKPLALTDPQISEG